MTIAHIGIVGARYSEEMNRHNHNVSAKHLVMSGSVDPAFDGNRRVVTRDKARRVVASRTTRGSSTLLPPTT